MWLFHLLEEPPPETLLPPPTPEQKTVLQQTTPTKKRQGVLSTFQFTNSPYLSLSSYPSKFVPIMVLSKASNIEVRDSIRRTWGFYRPYRNDTLRIKTFFIVGTDDFMTNRIITEQIVFDDVIQVSVPDMYTFSGYKELAAMVWVRDYLPGLPFYVKAEDAFVVNMKSFVNKFLPIMDSVADQSTIVGWYTQEQTVPRGAYQKFVDDVMAETSGELKFAINLLYGVTASAADRMIETLAHVKQIDYPGDPFVTGILRDAANVEMTNLEGSSENLRYELANGACKTTFETTPDLLVCTTSLHVGPIRSMSEYFEAWSAIIQQG